jgi:hypothetical protein
MGKCRFFSVLVSSEVVAMIYLSISRVPEVWLLHSLANLFHLFFFFFKP